MKARYWILAASAFLLGSVPSEAQKTIYIGGIPVEEGSSGFAPAPAMGATCDVLSTCPPVTANPAGLTWDGTHIWLGHTFSGTTLYRMNPVTCEVDRTIEAPGNNISGLAWDGSTLWVHPEQTGQIFRINPADGSVLATINAPSFGDADPNCGDLAWDGTYLWITEYLEQQIHKLDPATGAVLQTFLFSFAPGGLGYRSGFLAATDYNDDMIHFIDASTGSVVQSCAISNLHAWGLEFTSPTLWNAGQGPHQLYFFDAQVPVATQATTWGRIKIRYQ
jgi:glutamine cyclotransferase